MDATCGRRAAHHDVCMHCTCTHAPAPRTWLHLRPSPALAPVTMHMRPVSERSMQLCEAVGVQ